MGDSADLERELKRALTPWASFIVYGALYCLTLGLMLFAAVLVAELEALSYVAGPPRKPWPDWVQWSACAVALIVALLPLAWWVKHRAGFGGILLREGRRYPARFSSVSHSYIRSAPITNARVEFTVDGVTFRARASAVGHRSDFTWGASATVVFTPRLPVVAVLVDGAAPLAAALGHSAALFAHPTHTRVADLAKQFGGSKQRLVPSAPLRIALWFLVGMYLLFAVGALLARRH